MSTHSKNFITAASKTPESSSQESTIVIDLADNFSEVRGFGQPIPIALAKTMTANYYNSYREVSNLLTTIKENKDNEFDSIINNEVNNARFQKLRTMFDPDNHIVSGVFGKEIILQTIAQKECEGIRYMIGQDSENKITVILAGVKETEYPDFEENFKPKEYLGKKVAVRKSELIPNSKHFQEVQQRSSSKREDPTVPEVHVGSLTVQQLQDLLFKKYNDFDNDVNDVLFGEY